MKYLIKNNIYQIVNCTLDDVDKDILRVYEYASLTGIDNQIERMKQAVINSTAYKIIDINNNTLSALYYSLKDYYSLVGITFFHTTYIDLVLLFEYIRNLGNFKYCYIPPHNNIVKFKSLVEESSVRQFYSKNTPLVIYYKSNKYRKIIKLYNRLKSSISE